MDACTNMQRPTAGPRFWNRKFHPLCLDHYDDEIIMMMTTKKRHRINKCLS